MNDWSELHSSEAKECEDDEREDAPDAVERPWCHLLHESPFLEKMVKPYRIHQLRLVCKQWYKDSTTLPAHLHDVPLDKLQEASETYKNAESISLTPVEDERRPADVLGCLSSFSRLTSLALGSDALWECEASFAHNLCSLTRIRSLDISMSENAVLVLDSALRVLTSLTSLTVEVIGGRKTSTSDPFTELTGIQELTLSSDMLIDNKGKLLFPSLICLTSLCLFEGEKSPKLSDMNFLEVTRPYAATLQVLRTYDVGNFESAYNWSPLVSFGALRSLQLPTTDYSDARLAEILGDIAHLTELEIGAVDEFATDEMNALFALTALRSLKFACFEDDRGDYDWDNFANLTLLTCLSIEYTDAGLSLRFLTGLIILDIKMSESTDLDVAGSLMQLTLLEHLTLNTLPASDALSRVMSQLTNLRSIDLTLSTDPEEGMFCAMSCLPLLTCLDLTIDLDRPQLEGLTGINLVSNLEVLTIDVGPFLRPDDYLIEGGFRKLRQLHVRLPDLSAGEERDLFQKLPCLSRICNECFGDDS